MDCLLDSIDQISIVNIILEYFSDITVTYRIQDNICRGNLRFEWKIAIYDKTFTLSVV